MRRGADGRSAGEGGCFTRIFRNATGDFTIITPLLLDRNLWTAHFRYNASLISDRRSQYFVPFAEMPGKTGTLHYTMRHANLVIALDRFSAILPAVVCGISPDDARWRPEVGQWSILEIVRHLADEEVEDFRTRLRLTIEEPQHGWPRIDPEGWAVQRRYNEGDLNEAVACFVRERKESVKWLHSIPESFNWSQAHMHPRIGPIRVGDLLVAWAAHDALHLKQIAKRLYQIANRDGEGYSSRYAGEWTT